MNIITISREFGSGGRELAGLITQKLGYAYYDKEIINKIADEMGKDKTYITKALNNNEIGAFSISKGQSFTSVNIYDMTNASILAKQSEVVRAIAERNENCVIVGRNADVILAEYNPLRIFVCATTEARVSRCMNSSHVDSEDSVQDIKKMLKRIDKGRGRTREILTDNKWGDPHGYNLVVNTTGCDLEVLADNIVNYAKSFFRE